MTLSLLLKINLKLFFKKAAKLARTGTYHIVYELYFKENLSKNLVIKSQFSYCPLVWIV